MGTVYVKNGIRCYLYSREHNPPHIHVFYGDYEALFEIKTGKKMRGKLPQKQTQQIKKWLSSSEIKEKLTRLFSEMNPELRK